MRLTHLLLLTLVLLGGVGCTRSAKYYVDRGNAHFKVGKYQDALLEYRKALQKDTQSGEAYYRLGLLTVQMRKGTEAYQSLKIAEGLLPQREDVKVALGDVALEGYLTNASRPQKLYDDLTRIAQDLLARNPKSFDGLRFQADIAVTNGKLAEADELFAKANAVRPMQPNVVMPWVQTLIKEKRYSDAEKLGQELIRQHKDFGPMYDLLYAGYLDSNRPADAENLLKARIDDNPTDPDAVIRLARHYERQQRASELANTLKILLDDPRRFPEAHANVGDFYAANRKWEEAYRQYSEGLKQHPDAKLSYQRKIAAIFVSQGKVEEALPFLDEIIKQRPSDLATKHMHAILLLDSGKPERAAPALKEFKDLASVRPQDAVLRFNLGRAYLANGDQNSARTEFLASARLDATYAAPRLQLAALGQSRQNNSETLQYSSEVLAVNPQDQNAKYWHMIGLIGTGSYSQARSELHFLLMQFPQSADLQLCEARLDVAEKKFKDADATYRKLYKPGEKDLRPVEGIVTMYVAQKQFDPAIQFLTNELKQSPDSTKLHGLLAAVATQGGNTNLAIQHYQWLISKNPKDVNARIQASELYRAKGDATTAMTYLQEARKLDPQNAAVIALLAGYASSSRQEQQSVEDYRQLAQKHDDPLTLNNLAFLLADSGGDLDDALKLVQQAQQKLPNNPGIADTLGWIYTKKNMNDSAIQVFTNLVKKFPNEPDFRYHLGVALLQKGEKSKAKIELELALSQQPHTAVADKIRAAIGQAESATRQP